MKQNRIRRARTVVLLLAVLGAPIVVEGGVRYLIFGKSAWAKRHGAPYRDAALFANGMVEDEYWKLRYLLAHPERDLESPHFDPLLGWRSELIRPATYAHREQRLLRGRRPILLYGASFAKGYMTVEGRFERLLEATEAADEFQLLNHAVHGHGIDQTYLLLEKTLPRYAALDPVVIVGLVMETDLDRVAVSFRSFPKPRLREGTLAPERPVERVQAHLERDPLRIRSYAWRMLLHGTELVPARWRDRLAGYPAIQGRKKRLIREILREMDGLVRARGLDFFFLLFHDESKVGSDFVTWQEALVLSHLAELEIPYVSTRDALRQAAAEQGVELGHFYSKRHLNTDGNRVVVGAIRRGLAGDFSGP